MPTSNDTPEKPCNKCGKPYPHTLEFFRMGRPGRVGATCRKCHAATKKVWRAEHPEKVKEEKKRSHQRRREHNNARARRWYENNREYCNAKSVITNRELYANSLEYRAMHKARAHQRRMLQGELTKELILELYAEQEGRCIYCGITLHDDYTLEHVNPISRGGTNERDNLACACGHCNYSKNDKLLSEWQAIRGW